MTKRELAKKLRLSAIISENNTTTNDPLIGLYGQLLLSSRAIDAYYCKTVNLRKIKKSARPQLCRAVARALEHGLKVDLNA